jgi:hypothetical protein
MTRAWDLAGELYLIWTAAEARPCGTSVWADCQGRSALRVGSVRGLRTSACLPNRASNRNQEERTRSGISLGYPKQSVRRVGGMAHETDGRIISGALLVAAKAACTLRLLGFPVCVDHSQMPQR